MRINPGGDKLVDWSACRLTSRLEIIPSTT